MFREIKEIINHIKEDLTNLKQEVKDYVKTKRVGKTYTKDLEEDINFMLREKSDYVNNPMKTMEGQIWVSVEEFPKQEEIGLSEYLNIIPQ